MEKTDASAPSGPPSAIATEGARPDLITSPVYGSWKRTLQLGVGVVDAIIFLGAFAGAVAIRLSPELILDYPAQAGLVPLLMMFGLARFGAYEVQGIRSIDDALTRIGTGAVAGLVLVMLASYVAPDHLAIGRGVFALNAALAVPPLLAWRRILFWALRKRSMRARAIVLGEPASATKVAEGLRRARYGGAEVVGIVTPDPGAEAVAETTPVLGSYRDVGAIANRERVAQIVIVDRNLDDQLPLDDVLALRRAGVSVDDGATVYEGVTGRLLLEKLTPGWLLFAHGLAPTPQRRRTRRLVEAVLALLALTLLAPVFAAIALAIKLGSRGPIFYRQTRVGRGGRPYEILKFRSMREDAEAESGPTWAAEDDPRVTFVGRILRRTRLDELPQLWNVFRGEMSFIGPRPERPEFVELLRREIPHYDQRHTVLPGITGWAQVSWRYGATVDDGRIKLEFDLYYIQNMSMLLDLEILLGTGRVILGAGNPS